MHAAAFRRALLLTNHRPTAEDAAQEAVARLLGQAPGAVRNPGAWLLQVASRLAYDWLRRRRREVLVAAPPEPAPPDAWGAGPAGAALARAEAAQVHATLAQLPARDRVILLMRHSGAPYREIAQAVGCSPGSVGTLLVRAERRFRQRYDELVEGRPPGRR